MLKLDIYTWNCEDMVSIDPKTSFHSQDLYSNRIGKHGGLLTWT